MKRILSLLLLAFLVGSIKGQTNCDTQVNTNIQAASAAMPDSYFQGTGTGQAVTFNNVKVANTANNYNFINNGITSTDGGQNLFLNGVIQPTDGSTGGNYNVRLAFTKTDKPTDVKQELSPEAYTTGGVDINTWNYYQVDTANSVLSGLGAAEGNSIQLLPNQGTALQVGKGASGKNIQNGLSGWFLMNVTNPNNPSANLETSGMDVLDINVNLGCESDFNCLQYILTTAIINTDMTKQTNQNQALYVAQQSSFFNSVQQWDLAPNTANSLTLNSDNGGAHILLNLYPQGTTYNSSNTLVCSLNYVPVAAPSMPKQELDSNQYVQNGGSINPFSWVFYGLNSDDSSCSYNGATLTGLGLQDNMPMQLGVGASGKNGNFGLASWISFEGGYFDINLDANCGNPDTNLGETSPPATTAPVETCPPGCQPIPLTTEAPVTETPAAGNDATNLEISKLFVAVLSLFILAFFH